MVLVHRGKYLCDLFCGGKRRGGELKKFGGYSREDFEAQGMHYLFISFKKILSCLFFSLPHLPCLELS